MNQMTTWPPSIPGCPPASCFDPTALLQCYADLQAQTALTKQILLNLLATDPDVTAAIIAAIEKSGSTLPTLGVTNGTDAQPGQVGEWVLLQTTSQYLTTPTSNLVTLGILQPGDWDCWTYAYGTIDVNDAWTYLNPLPPGFSGTMLVATGVPVGPEPTVSLAPTTRALISVPTLIALQVLTNQQSAGPGAGTWTHYFAARRAR